MLKLITKLSAFAISIQMAVAAPAKIVGQIHTQIISEVKADYDKSSQALAQNGLKAFFTVNAKYLSEFDQAFLASKLKGLHPLAKISITPNNTIEVENIVNGKNQPLKIEIIDAATKTFALNDKEIKVEATDGIEDVYKKIGAAFNQKLGANSYLETLVNSIVPRAHAITTSTWIAGSVIAISLAVIFYQLGKKSGEKNIKRKMAIANNAKSKTNNAGGTIKESSPLYMENPSTDAADQSSDVVTPHTGN